jgi:1-acyl-sn-glycerol-3-phosphate acyltransferase
MLRTVFCRKGETMVLEPTTLQRMTDTDWGQRLLCSLAVHFRSTMHNADRIPATSGALIVSNHTLLGLDALPLTALIALWTKRTPRFLGERNLWRFPGAGRILEAVGAIPGTREGALELLRAGELVCVYPGGVDDSFKLSSEAYQLKWGNRLGFATVAYEAGVPIVPIAATGIDEFYTVETKEPWLGRWLFGSDRYDLPIPRNLLPKRVPLDYYVLPPIAAPQDSPKDEAIAQLRQATFESLDQVLAGYRDT